MHPVKWANLPLYLIKVGLLKSPVFNLTLTLVCRLFWPKSQCFDYLYRDAEILLQNYPVQATICLYEDSDSDDDDSDSDEEDEKQLNWSSSSLLTQHFIYTL